LLSHRPLFAYRQRSHVHLIHRSRSRSQMFIARSQMFVARARTNLLMVDGGRLRSGERPIRL
jgi:hypothetical protein